MNPTLPIATKVVLKGDDKIRGPMLGSPAVSTHRQVLHCAILCQTVTPFMTRQSLSRARRCLKRLIDAIQS